MKEVVYIGNSQFMVRMLQQSGEFEMVAIISEPNKCDWDSKEKVVNKINVHYVENAKDILGVLSEISTSIAIMYNFGIIIPKEVIAKLRIFNFHPGDLRTNRGSSPINWSILLGDAKTKMSLYEISEKIDLGQLISEKEVKIEKIDSIKSLREKLESQCVYMLSDLYSFLEGKITPIPIYNGIYRRRIIEKDYTIDFQDSEEVIKNKIRSQAEYDGAILNLGYRGGVYRVKSYDEYLQIIGKFKR